MPNIAEMKAIQKSSLFDLLKLKKGLKVESKELDELILKVIVAMEEEDVAWVEKQVAKL